MQFSKSCLLVCSVSFEEDIWEIDDTQTMIECITKKRRITSGYSIIEK